MRVAATSASKALRKEDATVKSMEVIIAEFKLTAALANHILASSLRPLEDASC